MWRCDVVVMRLGDRGRYRHPQEVCLLLFYVIATVFQLYLGSDMIDEMTRRTPEPTLLPTKVIFNLLHHIGMVSEELVFDDTISYTQ